MDEIAYMKVDEDSEGSNSDTEYEELKNVLSKGGISLVDYKMSI